MSQTPERKREWAALRRAERRAFAYQHLGGVCRLCKGDNGLEIDHVDRHSKRCNVSALWTHSEKRFLRELKKCQLLCKDCHLKKSIKERYPERQHGTVAMYGRGRCRCDLCREASARYHKKYRKEPTRTAPVHGTERMYTHHACRCQPCRDAHAAKARADRLRRAL